MFFNIFILYCKYKVSLTSLSEVMKWKIVPVIPFLPFSWRRPSHRHKHLQKNIGPIKTYCSYDKLTTKTDVVSNKGHQKFPPENEECVLDWWEPFSHVCMVVISFHFHPFPASKFRVLLAIWFVSFYNPNSLVSGENVWCSYKKASYRSHLLPDNHLPFLFWPHDPV